MGKFFSIRNLRTTTLRIQSRFSICLAFIAALTIALCWMICKTEDYNGTVIFYLSAGALLSLMLHLWGEETKDKNRYWTVSGACHLALLIDAAVLYTIPSEDFGETIFYAHGAVIVAMVLGICFLPFYKNRDDVESWNFVRRVFFGGAVSWLVSGIVCGGVELLLVSANILFNLNLSDKVFGCTFVLCFLTLPLLLFLGRIPYKKQKHDPSTNVMPFLMGVTRYLFIPLLIAYIIVSLFYVLKTLFTWELPNGQVSWLVTAMVAGLILVEFLLYPALRGEAKAFERKVALYAPLFMIPAIILMSVGLVRRFSDYGITAPRLYMLTLNLWFYAVCLGLYLTRAKRIHWISLSFGALLLLTSSHPLNFRNITKWNMKKQISEYMKQNKPANLPMNENDLKKWLFAEKDSTTRAKMFETFRYLNNNYKASEMEGWIKKDSYIYKGMINDNNYDIRKNIEYKVKENISIPQGFSTILNYDKYYGCEAQYVDAKKQWVNITFKQHNYNKGYKYQYQSKVSLAVLEKACKDSTQLILTTDNPDIVLVPTNLNFYIDEENGNKGNIDYAGYADLIVFKK